MGEHGPWSFPGILNIGEHSHSSARRGPFSERERQQIPLCSIRKIAKLKRAHPMDGKNITTVTTRFKTLIPEGKSTNQPQNKVWNKGLNVVV